MIVEEEGVDLVDVNVLPPLKSIFDHPSVTNVKSSMITDVQYLHGDVDFALHQIIISRELPVQQRHWLM